MEKANKLSAKQGTEERLVWEGTTLRITYAPNWLGVSEIGHLEVHVVEPQGAPLPITGTGYRSHFLGGRIVEEYGGASAYVRQWLDEEALSPEWRQTLDRWRQLSLL